MQSNSIVFQRKPNTQKEPWYHIDQQGINHQGYNFYCWDDVLKIEAWISGGEDVNAEELEHLCFWFRSGRSVRFSEMLDYKFYSDLENSLVHFLPGINPAWKETVWRDYQTRFRQQSWWRQLLLSYPNKPVIFQR